MFTVKILFQIPSYLKLISFYFLYIAQRDLCFIVAGSFTPQVRASIPNLSSWRHLMSVLRNLMHGLLRSEFFCGLAVVIPRFKN